MGKTNRESYKPKNRPSSIYYRKKLGGLYVFLSHDDASMHGHKSTPKTNRMLRKALRRALDREERREIEEEAYEE